MAKSKKVPQTRGVKTFYLFADWSALWDSWYLTLRENGSPRYKTIRQFAKAKSRNIEQQRFLEWYLGPPLTDPATGELVDDPKADKYKFAKKPQDWKLKRDTHGWYSESAIKTVSREITHRTQALDKLAAAGDSITLNSLARMEQLAQRLDKEFRGRFFADNLSWDQNEKRAQLYVSLHQKLLGMIGKAQDIYAKSHGINFDDMEGFAHIIAASISVRSQVEGGAKTQVQGLLEQFAQMTIAKSVKHKLPLPVDYEAKIVDVKAEPLKKKVQ